jgi:hypothetical protein
MLTNIKNQSQSIKNSLNQHENIFGIEGANITRSNIQVVDGWTINRSRPNGSIEGISTFHAMTHYMKILLDIPQIKNIDS